MRLSLVGVNHRTTPVAVRERLAVSGEKVGDWLAELRPYVAHAVVLSTCNRTEVYASGGNGADPEKASLEFLTARAENPDELASYFYTARDGEAAGHLFRVCSGLESQVLGEFEVLGQVGQALEVAEKLRMVDLPLRRLFQGAVRAGRRVRRETGISRNALSVSSVAVEMAVGVVGDLGRCRLLVIGAGEAGRLVARVARERGTPEIVIASRTRGRAETLAASLGGRAVGLEQLPEELARADIVVTCAVAPHRILDRGQVEAAMSARRPGSPLVVIDIGVPRNVAPEVANVAGVFLYDIDALTETSARNLKQRETDITRARDIVAAEVDRFVEWWRDLQSRPMVRALMGKAEMIRARQLEQTMKKLPPLTGEQRENLEAMTRSIVTRIMEDPIRYLKAGGNGTSAELLRDVFHLDDITCQAEPDS